MEDDQERLSNSAHDEITNPKNERYLSYVSIWEIALKLDAGRLKLDVPLNELVERACDQADIILAPLQVGHIMKLVDIPRIHSDPFDRLLISQAIEEGMAIVTADKQLKQYQVPLVW